MIKKPYHSLIRLFLIVGVFMNIQENTFYFLKEAYFKIFTDNNLMRNHERINNELHNRPCFYALRDKTKF